MLYVGDYNLTNFFNSIIQGVEFVDNRSYNIENVINFYNLRSYYTILNNLGKMLDLV